MGVQSDAINTLAEVHNRQVKKGLETYGKPVVPFNGRSAYNDAMEEIVDTAVYVTQLEQERTILKLALESLYGACTMFLGNSNNGNSVQLDRLEMRVRSVVTRLSEVGCYISGVPIEESLDAFSEAINKIKDDALGVVNGGDHPAWDEGWEAGVQGKWPKDNPFFNDDLCKQHTAGELFELSDIWEAGRKVGFKRHRQNLMDQLETAIYDAEDIGEGGVAPNPICPKCGDELEWDSGDDSVGWPGQWHCALCDREGVVEDEA